MVSFGYMFDTMAYNLSSVFRHIFFKESTRSHLLIHNEQRTVGDSEIVWFKNYLSNLATPEHS